MANQNQFSKLRKAMQKLKPENLRYRQIENWQEDELANLNLIVTEIETLLDWYESN